MAAAATATEDSGLNRVLRSLDESKTVAMRTAGLAGIAESVYITEDGSLTGEFKRGRTTLHTVNKTGYTKKIIENTIYKTFHGVFTFLKPNTPTGVRLTLRGMGALLSAEVSLLMLLKLPPGKYISIKSPSSEDRVYFYRSMTDEGRIYFYSGVGKTGSDAKLGKVTKKGLLGGVVNRYGKTRVASSPEDLRVIVDSFVQVHTNNKDIPAGRHTRRMRGRRGIHRQTRRRRSLRL